MKINWTVRFRNPVFWVNIAVAIILPVLTYMGLSWQDMTSWEALGGVLLGALKNPVIVVAVIVSVWNAVNDPTTCGIGDSTAALQYTKPKKN